ncbi:MAG: GNAT family N-acetyltransferase [Chitinophagaceae bacterium]
MDKIQLQIIGTNDALYVKVLALRDAVLRKPIDLCLFTEDLSGEVAETIIIILSDENVIGCGMLKCLSPEEMQLRQMAVDKAFQGLGIGRMLVAEAELLAKKSGAKSLLLHARQTAIPFYEKCGYSATGAAFTEVGIPHLLMKKELA